MDDPEVFASAEEIWQQGEEQHQQHQQQHLQEMRLKFGDLLAACFRPGMRLAPQIPPMHPHV